jgi:hypothetical protein
MFFILFSSSKVRKPASGPGPFSNSPPEIPLSCLSPPPSYIQQQREIRPDVVPLIRGFPTGLVTWNFPPSNFFGIIELSIRTTRPANCNVLNLIHVPGALPMCKLGTFFLMFIPCIVNDLQTLTVPTNSQFCCCAFHSELSTIFLNTFHIPCVNLYYVYQEPTKCT